MKSSNKTCAGRRRDGERGAAMITAVLISMLVLTGGGALLMITTLSATGAIDATTEVQAYYAAESGIQGALNVLRGNVQPNPQFAAAGSPLNQINFRRAVYSGHPTDANEPGSNLAGEATQVARLSRWLPYNFGFNPPRVTVSPNYNVFNGSAYAVEVSDPDDTHLINVSTSGQFTKPVFGSGSATAAVTSNPTTLHVEIGGGKNLTLLYEPKAAGVVNAHPPVASDLGVFKITAASGNIDFDGSPVDVRPTFTLVVNQTAPWASTVKFVGEIKGKLMVSGAGVVNLALSTLRIEFKSAAFMTRGATFTLPSSVLSLKDTYPATTVSLTLSAQEPERLLIRSTGFGPRGSRKVIQTLLSKFPFTYNPVSTLLVRGADDCSDMPSFIIGDSNAKKYSGDDASVPSAGPLPVIGTTCAGNQAQANAEVNAGKVDTVTSADQKVGLIGFNDLPSWLQDADQARAFLRSLETTARLRNRYFTSTPASFGTSASPTMTFVDGDCALNTGAGLLVVTGTLTIDGNISYDGLILVLGEGRMIRSGGGNGDLMGGVVVARFARTWPASQNNLPHPFLAPTFDTSGGGTSTVGFDSEKIRKALGVLGFRTLGVMEN